MNKSIEIVVASTNPIKIKATETGFEKMFPGVEFKIESISVKSNVRDQPMTSDEARNGARNRARNAKTAIPEANFWVGLEGGVEKDSQMFGPNLRSVVWCAILKAGNDLFGEGQPGSYSLPQEVARLIIDQGMELGQADDVVFNRVNSKQGEGSVGILTHGVLNRGPYYVQAVLLALIPFRNPTLYPQK